MNDIKSLGTQPISDAQPCGIDVRDDPDFELLQNEIAKLTNPAASGTPDWEQVVRLSSALLAGKGKDILVASYLTGALLITRGLAGLNDGAQMLEGLVATHWDQLYPPLARLRARRNAVQWLIDRVRAHAEEHDWSSWPPQDAALVDGLRDALAGIDRVLAEKDDDAPSMQPLRALLGTVQVAEPAPVVVAAPEPVAPAASIAPVAPVAAAASVTPAPSPSPAPAAFADAALAPLAVDSSDNASRATDEALERLAAIGAWYAQNEPSSALGFRLRRMGAWAGIERAPAANGTDTPLPGPIPQLQDALRNLQSRAAHADVIAFAETQVAQYPFWLDVHYAAATSLALLGETWSAARREVCNETAKFVARMDGIERLKFANGVPFANADTVQWLGTLASPGADAGASAAPDPLAAVMSRARALAADNDLPAAAQCLQDAIDKSAAVVGRLRLRTALCDLLLEHRPGARLDAFARALVEEIDRYGVTSWDADLSADALRAAYAILSRNDQNEAETAALLARIAPLNVAIAVRLIT
ncbi:type VI secretion system protein TssA [Caballeronia insecticola]|uniref:Type VI secretion-associated protein VC_A0119 family n=1 Tax=Caballeronia insecticola TaxID=758793 RepID=R4WYG7_9BURK|nr:type VI secretion system protein TssA [Caballeronia insecticola]BAN26540.1 type VI secretion-associated protein VC_A0119 family [Caballeronia insecticola]